MEKLRSGFTVEISGNGYVFSNQIGMDRNLFESFNKLSKGTFGLSFERVGGEYEPHVLAQDGKVCANVSVNQIPFYHRGHRKLYIQLGTVMTDLDFRGKGLSRWLMEYIIEKWKSNCDVIYLFANDSVLDFYPKFGFSKTFEYEYKQSGINPNGTKGQKLQASDEGNIHLVLEKYKQGNPFSAFYMAENQGLLSFYCRGLMKENLYYSSKYDVVIIAENKDGQIRCCDIWGETDAELRDVLGEISSEAEEEILLGFTPLNTEGLICQKHCEENTTLFVHSDGYCPFKTNKLMFPIISHA
ncbi:GNAT family N-acetyltransferase [Desulfosporosinus shakirovi]|uniref:GNAT family N-acetyltransferase n=1 Tax=Desulfosporosinus shakirovi TaxID=2885154 RepID=UPI001E393957|nr:GNAT family N-acetyltransferase [Desulfosporosinus sp. SRJS8]MCB8817075.1 GNAT family N-acetyltransferase [Desulfosporosinus sp. SRJS8]